MFNLLVKYSSWGAGRDSLPLGRMLEYTNDETIQQFKLDGSYNSFNFEKLSRLPCLFAEETNGANVQMARTGTIARARISGNEVLIEFSYDLGLPSIPQESLVSMSRELGIADFEFSRTHWAVKDQDLFQTILRWSNSRRQAPKVFQLAEYPNIERTLLSVMMPFDSRFDSVYAALKQTSESVGFKCRRADDIWENPAVIQDVVSLVDRSKVVICDCSNRNANVFYEAGIAHTLGREVILITQSESDIPFDLRHLRYVRYLNNGEGLATLSAQLRPRLAELFQTA